MVSQNDVILADEWFFKAKQALGFARTGLPEAQYYDWICFLCHQAVELYSFEHYSREQAEEAVKLASEVEGLITRFREEVDPSARSEK